MTTKLKNSMLLFANILFILFSTQLSATPINDDLCNAISIASDGSCIEGTTVNANPDYDIDLYSCSNIDHSSVYFETTVEANTNSITIDINNFVGNIAVSIWVPNIDCNNEPTYVASYCGNALGLPTTLFSVEGNLVYYIQIATATNQESAFEICVTENHPPANCAENDFCSQAEVINIATQEDCSNSWTGCNFGASPTNACNLQSGVVWYYFESDATANLLSLYIESNQVINPSITLFVGDCTNLIQISSCSNGSNGRAYLENTSIEANTGYYIAIGNGYGLGGEFELCGFSSADENSCLMESKVFVQPGSPDMGSADTGPFKPGETVELCFEITNYVANSPGSGNECQWLHGIVPVFGKGWDLSTFDPITNLPPSLYDGNWNWYEEGITYNSTGIILTINDFDGDGVNDICHNLDPSCPNTGTLGGTIVPPGWFFSNEAGQNNPNAGFGDGNCCNCVMGPWLFCFEITTASLSECEIDTSLLDCSVEMFTLADGETGSWFGNGSVCEADVPAVFSASLNCSDPIPVPIYQEAEVCSGQLFSIPLSSTNIEEHYFVWNVAPNNNEATSGYGQVINQRLINETADPLVITLSVFAVEKETGFQSVPIIMPITVLPEVVSEINEITDPICVGACIELVSTASGGSGFFADYSWNENLANGQTTSACPENDTDYAVTITDTKGCFASDTITVFIDLNYQDSFFLFNQSCDPNEVGINIQEYQNVLGCDSIVRITTSLLESDTTNLTSSTCDPDEIGIMTFVFLNQNLCDSLVIETTTLVEIPAMPVAPEDLIIQENDPPFELLIAEVTGATEYLWTVPTGVQIQSGQSTNAITIDWGNMTDGLVCVSAINECGSSEADCTAVSVDFANSINSLEEYPFMIFPSPATEYIHVVFQNDKTYELSLIDSQGKVAIAPVPYIGKASLFVDDLATGVYWVKVFQENEIHFKKVVVE